MSHFSTLVLVEPKKGKFLSEQDIEKEVQKRLAPYDENKAVPNYKRKCYCVGLTASRDARDAVEHEDPLDGYRTRFAKEHPLPEGTRSEWDLPRKERKAREQAWAKMIEPYLEREKRYEKEHEMYGKPNPNCDECGGSGRADSTYNPKSKWDWWQIGGRFTGRLGGYDPTNDPDNYETCFLCKGTGKRNDELGRKERERDPTYTCNGCGGKGKSLKFSGWKNVGNIAPSRDVLALVEKDAFTPFAVVTPDAQWHESAEMGWWAMTSNDKDEAEWKAEVVGYLAAHPTSIAVLVDCHI